ncbi:plasminogen-binding N-terminal domain-containing protein [bacterium]|nr:plasminogen-binding N-terminal domain-containing protein [bacterium]MBU1993852.1 plasminogen-binding N-terminal domain-containing protein [bacterium]
MKYIFLLFILIAQLFGMVIKSPIVSVDKNKEIATIHIDKIDVGMSGFIVHKLNDTHSSILKNVVVEDYNKDTQTATLKLSDYDVLRNNSLPKGKWRVEVGDIAVLAFGYSRAFLVAPSEEIFHRITTSAKTVQWVHPDIFATILSFNGHPTPLKEDFDVLSNSVSVGLLFVYLNQKLYTLDSKSFKILNISEAPLVQKSVTLPFYTRVEKIDAAWWGEGSSRLEDYEPYYYELLLKYNQDNKELQEMAKKFSFEKKKKPLKQVENIED